jgi:hypothetical protein
LKADDKLIHAPQCPSRRGGDCPYEAEAELTGGDGPPRYATRAFRDGYDRIFNRAKPLPRKELN